MSFYRSKLNMIWFDLIWNVVTDFAVWQGAPSCINVTISKFGNHSLICGSRCAACYVLFSWSTTNWVLSFRIWKVNFVSMHNMIPVFLSAIRMFFGPCETLFNHHWIQFRFLQQCAVFKPLIVASSPECVDWNLNSLLFQNRLELRRRNLKILLNNLLYFLFIFDTRESISSASTGS